MPIAVVASYTSFESCTVAGNLGKNYALHVRASVGYEFPFLKKSIKTPFTVSILCIQTTYILFFTGKFRMPRRGHPWSMT